jgi:Tol biopolymer transport system component
VLDVATGAVRRLIETSQQVWGPHWSADGSLVVWQADATTEMVRADGSDRRRLDVRGYFATLLPDNRTVVSSYWGRRDASAEYDEHLTDVLDLTTGEMRQLVGEQRNSQMVPSPDGRNVAYGATRGDGLRVIGIDGTNDRALPGTSSFQPVWSPDGSLVTFRNPDGDGLLAYDIETGITRPFYGGVVDTSRYVFAGPQTLLIERGKEILVVDLASGETTASFPDASLPRWDAVRGKVLFRQPANAHAAVIVEANLDGSARRTVIEKGTAAGAAGIGWVEPSPVDGAVLFHCIG